MSGITGVGRVEGVSESDAETTANSLSAAWTNYGNLVLGVQDMQQYYASLATTTNIINGTQVLSDLAGSTANLISIRAQSVISLVTTIEGLYNQAKAGTITKTNTIL